MIMEYYGNNDYRDYLAIRHHGILGMKWGQRNGPPYPLGSSDHSASEKKAGWRKSLGGGSSSSIRKKNRYITKESKRVEKQYNKDIKKSDKEVARAEKKYYKAAENGSARAQKLSELYRDRQIDSESLKRIKEKELERVRNMTSDDIKKEKAATKAQEKFLKDRISDEDEFYQQIKKRRENKQELQRTKSENRVTKGERNQIKEEARAEVEKSRVMEKNQDTQVKLIGQRLVEGTATNFDMLTLDLLLNSGVVSKERRSYLMGVLDKYIEEATDKEYGYEPKNKR